MLLFFQEEIVARKGGSGKGGSADNNTFSSIECYVSLSGFPVQGSRIAVLDDSDNQEITIQIFESVIMAQILFRF